MSDGEAGTEYGRPPNANPFASVNEGPWLRTAAEEMRLPQGTLGTQRRGQGTCRREPRRRYEGTANYVSPEGADAKDSDGEASELSKGSQRKRETKPTPPEATLGLLSRAPASRNEAKQLKARNQTTGTYAPYLKDNERL